MRYSLAEVTTLFRSVGLMTMFDSFCGLKHFVPSAKENVVSPTIASAVCVPANGAYSAVVLLNGAKRQRDTKIFPEGSGRAAIAASNCAGVNRPSSLLASGSGAEFLKRLPESAAAVNAHADTTRTIPNSFFMGLTFPGLSIRLGDGQT